MNNHYDYIIIGQGLAGSLLSHFLLCDGKKLLVIDSFNPNSASNIAAGVINPVTGRKIVKSWMIDDLLPFAASTYKKLEKLLNVRFYYEKDIYKIFSSEEDFATWNKKKIIPEYASYLGNTVSNNLSSVLAPNGIGIIHNSAWMDVPVFIKAYRGYLKKNESLLEENVDITKVSFDDKISYKDITANKIIFCEGYAAVYNLYFKNIPFTLAKGEQLLIHSNTLSIEHMYNKNIFIIPKGDNLYSVGSNFIWDDLTESVTAEGKKELILKLNKMIASDYAIIEEKAGIRPTMIDRRPVLGAHPDNENLYIFNGLGTKGVTLAPYFSDFLVKHFKNNISIPIEISLNRFVI